VARTSTTPSAGSIVERLIAHLLSLMCGHYIGRDETPDSTVTSGAKTDNLP
jgi:hypothetical protein